MLRSLAPNSSETSLRNSSLIQVPNFPRSLTESTLSLLQYLFFLILAHQQFLPVIQSS